MPKFKPGDFVYQHGEKGFHTSKILVVDTFEAKGGIGECYHVCLYEPTSLLPNPTNISDLKVLAMHVPVNSKGVDDQNHFIINVPVSFDELQGYYAFLRQTNFKRYLEETGQDLNKVISEANAHFRSGIAAHQKNMFDEAINEYTKAFEIFPTFFEALDNKGFALMSLGRIKEAAEEFYQSLSVNPDGQHAIFSFGECLLKLNQPQEALPYFQECANRWPEKKVYQDFVIKTQKILGSKSEA